MTCEKQDGGIGLVAKINHKNDRIKSWFGFLFLGHCLYSCSFKH